MVLSETFSLTAPKNIVSGTFCVCENFGMEKSYGQETGGGVSCFAVDNVWSHSAKKLRGGTFRNFIKFGMSKNFWHKKGVSIFSVETSFVSQCQKVRGELLKLSETFGCPEILCIRRRYHQSPLNAFLPHFQKNRRGTFLCFKKFHVSKTFMQRREFVTVMWK